MKRNSVSALMLVIFSLLVPVAAFLFWTIRTLPPPASVHGTGMDNMINYTLLSTGLLLLAGHIILGWFIWKFSRQDKPSYWLASAATEWKWALLPLVLMTVVAEGGVMIIGLPVWKQLHVKDVPADVLTVEVTAQQFAWYFRYPGKDGVFGKIDRKFVRDDNQVGVDPKDPAGQDDIVESGVLTLPANKLVRLKLRSKDVIHSFFLPNQRIKQDTVPGMVIDSWLTPTKAGKFEILCTELCGLGHYKMRGVLKVLEPDAFDKWMKEAQEEVE
jgi:cytochrome c oxidase subunit 2